MSRKDGDCDMPDSEIKRMVSASKKLNKLCKRIDNGFFNAEIFWCRAVYDGYERWNLKMHRHSFFEIHFGLSGKIEYDFDFTDKIVVLKKSRYLIIPPGVSHRILRVDEGSGVFKLAFRIEEPACIMERMKCADRCFYTGDSDSFMVSSIEFMLGQAMSEKPGFADAISSQLSAFSICMLQEVTGIFGFTQKDVAPDIDKDDRVRVVKQIIKDNLAEPLKNDDISRQVNISVRHLNRIIKHSDNMNLAELIRHMRMEKVKKLLATTYYSLDIIAEKTGFLSGSHLGRTFKAVEGCTPGQYRKDINT